MSLSSQKTNLGLSYWKEKLKETVANSKNDSIKKVLSNIENSKDQGENEYIQLVAFKMTDFTNLELTLHELDVIDLTTNIMKISQKDMLTCIKFAKINFKIINKNIEIVRSSPQLEYFIQNLCDLAIAAFEENNHKEQEFGKFIKIQLNIIIQLQIIFQDDGFRGNKFIIKLFLKLINADVGELEEHFITILTQQMKDPQFYMDVFSVNEVQPDESFLRYCLLIAQNINSGTSNFFSIIMTSHKQTNFVCLLMEYISNNLRFFESDAESIEVLLQEVTRLIIKSNEDDINFNVIEKELIEGLIGNGYSKSVLSFYFLCEFLLSIESSQTIKSYFILFQNLLLKLWNPVLFIFRENRQIYVIKILSMLYYTYRDEIKPLIVPELYKIFENSSDIVNENFNICFSKLKKEPTFKNYYHLLANMQNLKEIDKYSKDVIELIELVGLCDWTIFSTVVIKVIDFITVTTDQEQKMVYLLKFNPIDQIQKFDVPLNIKHKLLDMVLSFMSKSNGCDGLRNYIKKLLNILLESDISVRRLYLNSRSGKTVIIKEEETLIENTGDILKCLKEINTTHVCNKIQSSCHNSEWNRLEDLHKFEKYSKWLSNLELTQLEKEIVESIISNLQKTCSYPEIHSL